LYQNEVDKEIVDSRDKVKHNERSDQLFWTQDDVGSRARVTMDEERVLQEPGTEMGL